MNVCAYGGPLLIAAWLSCVPCQQDKDVELGADLNAPPPTIHQKNPWDGDIYPWNWPEKEEPHYSIPEFGLDKDKMPNAKKPWDFNAPVPKLVPAPAPPISDILNENVCVTTLDFGEIDFPLFEKDSAELTYDQHICISELADMIAILEKGGERQIYVIGGHASPEGTQAYNEDLSRQRAVAVKQALKAELDTFGLAPPISVAAHGESQPVGTYSFDVLQNDSAPDAVDPRDRRFEVGSFERANPPGENPDMFKPL